MLLLLLATHVMFASSMLVLLLIMNDECLLFVLLAVRLGRAWHLGVAQPVANRLWVRVKVSLVLVL